MTKKTEAKLTGTHTHADNAVEQTVIVVGVAGYMEILGVWLYLENMTKDVNIKVDKAHGGGDIEHNNVLWEVLTDSDAVYLSGWHTTDDITIILHSPVQEGAARSVDYEVIYRL